jgi:hypothetical protein
MVTNFVVGLMFIAAIILIIGATVLFINIIRAIFSRETFSRFSDDDDGPPPQEP